MLLIVYEDILKKKSWLNGRNKTESKIRLTINERLEQIANSVYVTDSVTDIANWIVNKPKAYRILYDAQRDIWGIADAQNITHMQIAREIYSSGYVIVPDEYISNARKMFDMYSNPAKDVFAKDAFYGNGEVYGAIFLPNTIDYRDYEEQGFYSAETMLKDGSMFTKRRDYFSATGALKDLYNKLDRMGQITGERKSLDQIAQQAADYGFSSFETSFCRFAVENGYTMDEANEYLRSLPEYSLDKMFQELVMKTMSASKAADLLRQRAKRFGYSKKEIEKFLKDFLEE